MAKSQKERVLEVCNAKTYREISFDSKEPMWKNCITFLQKYGCITASDAYVTYGEKDLSATVRYCKQKGYNIKPKRGTGRRGRPAVYVLCDGRSDTEENDGVYYTHSNCPRLWKVWASMRERCDKPSTDNYHRYGGRGIKVCEEWEQDFHNFAKWALNNGYDSEAPFGECTIDRIDTDGDYSPNNCRWVNMQQQQNNRSTNRLITFKGVTHTISEWSRLTGLDKTVIRRRIDNGWSVEEALTILPHKRCEHFTYNGATKSLSEWGEEYGISRDTLWKRLKCGWSIEKALHAPIRKQKNNRGEKTYFTRYSLKEQ